MFTSLDAFIKEECSLETGLNKEYLFTEQGRIVDN